jgi:hypothetical protein
MPDNKKKKPADDEKELDELLKQAEEETNKLGVQISLDPPKTEEEQAAKWLEELESGSEASKSSQQKAKEAFKNAFLDFGESQQARALNTVLAVGPSALALAGSAGGPGGAVAGGTAGSALRTTLMQRLFSAPARALASRPIQLGLLGLSGAGAMMEEPGDYGQGSRAVADLGWRMLDNTGPMKKFTALSPRFSKEMANMGYNIAQNHLTDAFGNLFEGDRKIHTGQPSLNLSVNDALGMLFRLSAGQTLKTANQLPRTVNPKLEGQLEGMTSGQKNTPEDMADFSQRLRDLADARQVQEDIPAALTPPKRISIDDINFRQRLADINAMPSSTPAEQVAKNDAMGRLVQEWHNIVRPDVSRQTADFDKLRLGDADPTIEDLLNPTRTWDRSRAAGTNQWFTIRNRGGSEHYEVNPTMARGPDVLSNSPLLTDMETPVTLKDSAVNKALGAGEAGFNDNKANYNWLNSYNQNDMARAAIKDAVQNYQSHNPGKMDQDLTDFVNRYKSEKNSSEYVKDFTNPKHVAQFNKYITDPQTREWGRRQFITQYISDLNAGMKEDSSRLLRNLKGYTDQNGKFVPGHERDEINKLFGNPNAYDGLTEIAEASEKAQRWYARRVGGDKKVNVLFPAIFFGYQMAKGLDLDSGDQAAMAYAIGAVGSSAFNALYMTPKRLDYMLSNRNGVWAKMLNRAWSDPVQHQHYFKTLGRFLSLVDKANPLPKEEPQRQIPLN